MEKIVKNIVQGIKHFKDNHFAENKKLFEQLAGGQKPRALMITCADSRVDPNLITNTEPGEIFHLRNAGNIIPAYTAYRGAEAATIEFALEALDIRHIIVCGHSDCGAIKGLLAPDSLDKLPAVKEWLSHAETARRVAKHTSKNCSAEELLQTAIEENVLAQVVNLKTHPAVAERLASRTLNLYGWVYKIGSGDMLAFDPSSRHFSPLTEDSRGIPFFATRLLEDPSP